MYLCSSNYVINAVKTVYKIECVYIENIKTIGRIFCNCICVVELFERLAMDKLKSERKSLKSHR